MNEQEQKMLAAVKIGGVYEHYKSTENKKMLYKVTGIARHSEDLGLVVIYTALYDCGKYGQDWARPLAMFLQDVEIDGKRVPRFRLVN